MNRKSFLATAIALITAPFIKAKEPEKTNLTINYKVDAKGLQQIMERYQNNIWNGIRKDGV